jgi:hypothetical protein
MSADATRRASSQGPASSAVCRAAWAAGLLLVIGIGVPGCGQNVLVTHGALNEPKTPVNMTVQVDELAANARKEAPNVIGTVTVTVFGLPTGDAKAAAPLPELVHPFVVEALEKTGYTIVDMRGKKPANVPILRGELRVFWFAVYTWAAPILYFGGNIEYRMVLQKPDGATLWEKVLKATSGNVTSWDGAINSAVTSLLNQIIDEVQTPEFVQALKEKTSATPEATAGTGVK